MSSTPTLLPNNNSSHEYKRPPSGISRAPCPALNTLANHGFVNRAGTGLTFLEVLRAIILVYNLSYPLAFILTSAGFLTCGKVSFNNGRRSSAPPENKSSQARASFAGKLIFSLVSIANSIIRFIPSFTLDLGSLSERGRCKITHDASFVHADGKCSTAPDTTLLQGLLTYALTTKNADGSAKEGLGLVDVAVYHAKRCNSSAPLDNLHAQIGLGECSLAWEMLSTAPHAGAEFHDGRQAPGSGLGGLIPVARLEQWFGEERLPDGWWGVDGVRPVRAIGVLRARRMANLIDELINLYIVLGILSDLRG
ncbi:hypothetical protein BJ912DRAFT_948673 [Pholiota molesta]|nr:hypothetical protein BJ912DRAFT_948673 [Pholiota molesta]